MKVLAKIILYWYYVAVEFLYKKAYLFKISNVSTFKSYNISSSVLNLLIKLLLDATSDFSLIESLFVLSFICFKIKN